MPSSRAHQFATAVLALGGGLLVVTALAILVARIVVSTSLPGIVVRSEDVALLDDLIAVLPFMLTFAAMNLAAGIGLAAGRRWAPRVATWVTGIAVATGLLGLLLLIAANGPVPSTKVAGAADPEGFGILSAVVCLYAWAAVALRLPEEPQRPVVIAAAA
jgi:hypothetical protein